METRRRPRACVGAIPVPRRAWQIAVLAALLAAAGCKSSEPADVQAVVQSAEDALAACIPSPAAAQEARNAVEPCEDEPWPTYGHDAQRTGTSGGCVRGALRVAWTFTPEGNRAREARAHHAVADGTDAYVVGVKGNSPTAHRLSAAGALVWTYDTRADIQRAHWPALAHGSLVVNDDGFYLLAPDTGKNRFDRGLDTWGQVLADESRWYLTNTWHVEGPGVYVGAFDPEGKHLWKQNKYGSVKEDVMDDVGAIALDDGRLFQAANYKFAAHSGVFAFDAATGERRWGVATLPVSDLSAGHGKLFLLEKEARGKDASLVARAQDTGRVAWETAAPGARAAAPVLAAGLVLIDRGASGVFAHRAATGELAWSAVVPGKRSDKVPCATTLLVAYGSGTVVVTSGDAVTLLSLADGRVLDGGAGALADVHSPVLVGRRLYVITGASLAALDGT